ncbi:MAG TPA: glycosyltransferase family 4 protein [Gaiellaceae bacterium]|nr:glycosyltransferase family 4 protein [Gaiellaceae bacterium]
MHVLIVSAWDPKSGVLSVYRSLARHLSRRGVRFSAFAFDGWSADTWWTFCDELIDGRTTTLSETLMSGRYDLIHCVDTTYAPPYGVEKWVSRARFRGPVILMAQQVERRQLRGPAHATRYVACSQAAADILAQDADRPVAVIPNGYDESVFRPQPGERSDRPLFVWVGRSYDNVKGVDLFLDAVEAIPNCEGIVVDSGSGESIASRLLQTDPRISHRPLLTPPELAGVLQKAAGSGGAFISTSLYEAFGIAAVEAMACECPVIAPRVPGHEHLIDRGNALVYDRAAGINGIKAAVEQLQDPVFRRQLVRQAREQAVENWTSRTMADAYSRLYEDALREPSMQHLADPFARFAWRLLLKARPWMHRMRRLHTC